MRRLRYPASPRFVRGVAPWLAPLMAGVLLFALFGSVPGRLDNGTRDDTPWSLPAMPGHDASAATDTWAQRRPWGGSDVDRTDDPGTAIALSPVPVAIVAGFGGNEAVFLIPGGGEFRTRAGDPLPDGGRVEQVDMLSVTWTDGQGVRHQQRLLADNLRLTTPTP